MFFVRSLYIYETSCYKNIFNSTAISTVLPSSSSSLFTRMLLNLSNSNLYILSTIVAALYHGPEDEAIKQADEPEGTALTTGKQDEK